MLGNLLIGTLRIAADAIGPVMEGADVLDQPTHHVTDGHSIAVPCFEFAQHRIAAPAPGTDRVGKSQNFQP